MGRIVNQTELAELIGVTDVTLWQWQKEGLPIKVRSLRGLPNQYDTAEVVAWMVDRATRKISGGETQEQRLKRVQADKIEMEMRQMSRDLVPAAEIEARWATIVMAARKRLLSLPGQLAELLEMAEGPAAKRDVLVAEIDKVLEELTADDDCERLVEAHVARLLERLARESAERAGDADAPPLGAADAPDGGAVGGGAPLPVGQELGHAGPLPAGGGAVHP